VLCGCAYACFVKMSGLGLLCASALNKDAVQDPLARGCRENREIVKPCYREVLTLLNTMMWLKNGNSSDRAVGNNAQPGCCDVKLVRCKSSMGACDGYKNLVTIGSRCL